MVLLAALTLGFLAGFVVRGLVGGDEEAAPPDAGPDASGEPTPVPTPPAVAAKDLEPVFLEEFDGPLDESLWDDCYHTRQGDGCTNQWNDELQWYLPEQRRVEDGALVVTTERRPYRNDAGEDFAYRSGMATTRPGFDFTYGYIEFSVDYPAGQGLWPALWLLPSSERWPPEIDVLEIVGHEPDIAYFNVHFPQDLARTRSDGSLTTGSPGAATIPGLSEGFHTFGLEWGPDRLDWYVDGELRYSFTDADRIPDEPMYAVINMAVGGPWAGDPDDTTELPAALVVDYVRVWQ